MTGGFYERITWKELWFRVGFFHPCFGFERIMVMCEN
jgi:hypothetical protein